MAHNHDHSGAVSGTGNRRLLAISLGITSVVLVVQVIGAILSDSLALFADAGHMLTDAAALVVALIANAVAARPANERRTYGYQRAEVFGALTNATILIVLAVVVGTEGIRRLLEPAEAEVQGGLMLAVAIVGLVANAIAMWVLSAAQKGNINVRGAYLEVMGDMIGSVAVIVAAVIIVTTGWMPADAIASLAIAVFIIPRAIGLLREVFSVLAQSAPPGTHVQQIREHILRTEGVLDAHDIHVWQLTRGAPVFTAHVVVADEMLAADQAALLLEELHGCLAAHFDVEHSTFQLEPEGFTKPERTRHA